MIQIIRYVQSVFAQIVNILNIKPFSDFPVSILQLMLCAIFLRYIFKIIFGGFKELDTSTNYFAGQISKNISNNRRKKQLNDDYKPRHAER